MRRCHGRACGLPGLGPPRELRHRGFAMGRRYAASFQAGKLLALLDQLQELCQGHRGRGCLGGSGSWARPFLTAGRIHGQRAAPSVRGKQTLPGGWVQPLSEGVRNTPSRSRKGEAFENHDNSAQTPFTYTFTT